MGLNTGILAKKTSKTKQVNDNAETLRLADKARIGSCASGLLLGHAVESAETEDQVAAGYADYFATGE